MPQDFPAERRVAFKGNASIASIYLTNEKFDFEKPNMEINMTLPLYARLRDANIIPDAQEVKLHKRHIYRFSFTDEQPHKAVTNIIKALSEEGIIASDEALDAYKTLQLQPAQYLPLKRISPSLS